MPLSMVDRLRRHMLAVVMGLRICMIPFRQILRWLWLRFRLAVGVDVLLPLNQLALRPFSTVSGITRLTHSSLR